MKDLPEDQQPKSSSSQLQNNEIPSATPYDVDADDDDECFYTSHSQHNPVTR